MAGWGGQRLAQVGGQDLDRGPAPPEDDGLDPVADEPFRDPLSGEQAAGPDPQLLVDERWVDDQDMPPAAWRAVVVDDRDRRTDQSFRQLAGVGDGGAGADENRVRPVMGADPPQAADDVGEVASEQPPVRVELVDDHVLEVLEELEPLRVVRKDGRVEHVRVADHDLPGRSNHAAHRWRSVAVIGAGLEVQLGGLGQGAELDQLVRGQGLGGEQVQGPRRVVAGDGVENRAGCSRGSCPRRWGSPRRRSPAAVPMPGRPPGESTALPRRGPGARRRAADRGPRARGMAGRPWFDDPMGGGQALEPGIGEERLDGLLGGSGTVGEHDVDRLLTR